VPSGLACCGPASISNTTQPGSTAVIANPINLPMGGGSALARNDRAKVVEQLHGELTVHEAAGPRLRPLRV